MFPADRDVVRQLWLAYLTSVSAGMQEHYGMRPFDPEQTVTADLATIAKFQPPDGRVLLALRDDRAIGIGCLRRIGDDVGEIKRMYVDPSSRGLGAGRAILEQLLAAARVAGYGKVRLDSAQYMTVAHALYRAVGFHEIGAYSEKEVPDAFTPHLVFMERGLP